MKLTTIRFVAPLSIGLLVVGLVVDLTTPSELIVAIIYNIPIALSSLALSRRLSVLVLVLALLANLAAGYENSLQTNGVDFETLLNRLLSAFSFLLVGMLTVSLGDASSQVEALRREEERSSRNEAVRHSLAALGKSLYPEALLKNAAKELQSLLDADEVVITQQAGDSFAAPRYASPPNATVARIGEASQWVTDVLPLTAPVSVLRQADGLRAVARLRRGANDPDADLLIIALQPRVASPKLRLNAVIEGLEPLLIRADELQRLVAASKAEDIDRV